MASVAAPLEVETTLAKRIEAARVAHRDAQETAAAAAAKYRAVVVEAVEAGMPQKLVAKLAGVARSRVHRMMVTEYSRP